VKIRNPKSENRRKSEIRNPSTTFVPAIRVPAVAGGNSRLPQSLRRSAFGFRISAFLRISDFGFRILPIGFCLLAAQPILAATTNSIDPDAIPPLRPPHAEIPPTFWEQHGVWLVILGVLLLAVVGAAVWFLTRPKPPVIVPPEVLARQALEPLHGQPEDGALLSRVSQILRHYTAAAFGLPPGELTTAEFCRAIAGHAQVGPELAAALSDFLRLCDHDKFSPPAPVPPLSAVARALKLIDYAQARRLTLVE
jgi:hypothetical protein